MPTIRRPSSARQVVSLESGESAPTSGPFTIGQTSETASPSPTPSPGTLPFGAAFALASGTDGEDGIVIPGPPGAQGPAGPAGSSGQSLMGPPGEDGEEGPMGMPIPGPMGLQGAIGATGATGPQGPIGFGLDGIDGEDGYPIPGPAGANGSGGGGGGLTQLAQVTTTAGQTSVTVMTSIPGTYKALLLEVYGGSAASTTTFSDQLGLQFNGDTTSGHYLSTGFGNYNTGTFNIVPVASTSMQVGVLPMTGAPGVHAGYNRVLIPGYTATAFRIHGIYNTSLEQNNVGIMNCQGSGEWAPTSLAAITSIVALNMNGNAFMTGTVITLYGES